MDNSWIKYKILPYDGRTFNYSSEWDNFNFKQEAPKEGEDMNMAMGMATQNFKFEGDGYYVEVKTDTSNGYK